MPPTKEEIIEHIIYVPQQKDTLNVIALKVMKVPKQVAKIVQEP